MGQAEWEVVDDNGFICKRRKKPEVDLCEIARVEEEHKRSAEAQQRFDQLLARKRKMDLLEAQKIKYTAEIEDWQRLLNIQELQIRPNESVIAEPREPSEHVSKEVVDDSTSIEMLEMHVETHERLIERLKMLLNVGQGMCKKLEKTIQKDNSQQFKGLIDEVTLLEKTPRTLISGLTSSQPKTPGLRGLAVSTDIGRLLAESPA